MDRFREWVSDNLRYILLVAAIFLVLIGVFFGVRAVMRSTTGSTEESVSSAVSSVTSPADSSDESEPEADHGVLTENADKDVSKLISDYYVAVSDRDVEKVRTLVDILSEEDAVEIENSVTEYSSVRVYTKNGPAAGSYVVYAYYEYVKEEEGQTTPLPGLAQMYVKKGSDGNWKIILGGLSEEEQTWIAAVGQDADVQALIQSVTEEYNTAVAAMESAASDAEVSSAESAESAEMEANSNEYPENDTDSVHEEQEEIVQSVEEDEEESVPEETPTPTPTPEPTPTYRDTVILSTCFVRSGPGYDYEVLTEVGAGTPVTVIGDLDDGWWHVYADGVYGYVGKSFIESE